MSAYVVTTTADSGLGSLRDAITQVNSDTSHALYASPTNPNVDEIDFNITADSNAAGYPAGQATGYDATTGVATIMPYSALPAITNAVLINGYTQGQGTSLAASMNTLLGPSALGSTDSTLHPEKYGDNAVLKVELDGENAGTATGLNLAAANMTVQGLVINRFANDGILTVGDGDVIQGNFIGTDVTGTKSLGNAGEGIQSQADDYLIGNLISGNGGDGILVQAPENVIEGNFIGTDVTGTKAVDNGSNGIFLQSGSNTIGAPAAGNLISGLVGVGILGSGVNNVIQGNFIGTDVTGKVALGNHDPNTGNGWGILFVAGSDNTTIGGTTAGAGNLISANDAGMVIDGTENMIEGNYIGTDVTGKTSTGTDGQPLGNRNWGVAIVGTNNTLGGTTAQARNIISGTRDTFGNGAVFLSGGATGNMVEGNYIGTDVTGEAALGNGTGVWIANASNDTISGNVISANIVGVTISSNGGANNLTSGNVVQDNLIGTDASGTHVLGTSNTGVGISSGQGTQLTGNVIAFTTSVQGSGVFLGNGSYGTVVQGNHIGTDVGNTLALGDQYYGIEVRDSSGNTISGNTIAHSGADGINLHQLNGLTSNNAINDNTITSNAGNGVAVNSGTGNSILGNSIHDNGGLGIYLNSADNANDNQAAPVLTTATSSATSTTVSGTLASVPPNTTFRIEFFSNAALDAEGKTYLGFALVTTDANGYLATSPDGSAVISNPDTADADFKAINLAAIPAGQGYLTATATNQSTGDTSQFSNYLTAPTATVLTSSANPSLLNQSVTFTATVSSSFGTPTGSVDFVDTTTNTELGTFALSSGGTASVAVSNLAVGSHVVKATYAGQGLFLGSGGTLTQQVNYKFSGFFPPLSNGLVFAVNRTIPVQFQLSNYNGKAITSLGAVTSLQIQALDAHGNPAGNPFNPTPTGGTSLSNSGGQYQFNWQTRGLAAGSYQIMLKLADGTTQIKTIQLTAGGSSAGLVTGSSGGTATAGALLGGEVDLYVDNSNGDLTSDELARIQDAVNAVDATIATYGVVINEVSDSTQANVTLNMNATSALGGVIQGVLGCTTDADQVTMIQGWNWYAGSDPTQIGAGQYDFETAVMHELGHVLGLGHSSSSGSVMYASLTTGTANRALVTADLNVPDNDSGPCALLAAPPVSGSATSNVPGLTAPGNGGSSVGVNPLLAELTGILSNAWNTYRSEGYSLSALWRQGDTLALQRLDALWSMEAGAMGVTKDSLVRNLFVASQPAPNGL